MHVLLIPFALFVLPLIVGVRLWLVARRWRTEQVLRTVASCMAQNLPLSPMLAHAAVHESRGMARIYHKLQRYLDAGYPLSSALHGACPAAPGETISALQAAEQTGTLSATVQRLANEYQTSESATGTDSTNATYYVSVGVIVLLLTLAVVTFHVTFVMPKFDAIMADFAISGEPTERVGDYEIPLLAPHTFLRGITDTLVGYSPLPQLLIVALLLLAAQLWLGSLFLVRRSERDGWWFGFWDSVVWGLPFLRRQAEYAALARQLPILEVAIRNGFDLPAAARQAQRIATNRHARRRMKRWANAMEDGAEPAQAARKAGLPRSVATVVDQANSPTELATAVAYLGDYYASLVSHWRKLVAAVLGPALVLVCGAIVAFLALAAFTPLIAIVGRVAEWAV